jgi:hypothetical protein
VDEVLLELDERRRASFGKLGKPEHRRYLAAEQPDGTIILTPAVVMTELEATFLANRELVERLEESRRHPERLVPRRRSS